MFHLLHIIIDNPQPAVIYVHKKCEIQTFNTPIVQNTLYLKQQLHYE